MVDAKFGMIWGEKKTGYDWFQDCCEDRLKLLCLL